DVARIEQGIKEYSFQEKNLTAIVRQVLGTMRYQVRLNEFQLRVQLPKKAVVTRTDPDAFSQALINLISNAIKYGRRGKYLKVALACKMGWVACSVEDRGVGISKVALEHLFERYYRDPATRRRVHGVGLGLSLVKHIAEAHGGRVEVRSTVGKGSVFTMLFPVGRDKPPPLIQEQSKNKRRIS
ncbi:MAG TPA: HAMP domain-containing sensor histidine kinase, partial [Bacteroidota bacterium]|nr:HAMP domain-containing sensor histidine kinase [Bacteroidota bacterium]